VMLINLETSVVVFKTRSKTRSADVPLCTRSFEVVVPPLAVDPTSRHTFFKDAQKSHECEADESNHLEVPQADA
jgi:hypothetical protein